MPTFPVHDPARDARVARRAAERKRREQRYATRWFAARARLAREQAALEEEWRIRALVQARFPRPF